MSIQSSATTKLLIGTCLLGSTVGLSTPVPAQEATALQMQRLVTLSTRNYTDGEQLEGVAALEALHNSPPSSNPPILVSDATYGSYLYWTGMDSVIDPNDTEWDQLAYNSRTRLGPAFLRVPSTPAKFQKSVISQEIVGAPRAQIGMGTQAVLRRNGDLIAGIARYNDRIGGERWSLENQAPRPGQRTGVPDNYGTSLVTTGALVRADADGTHASIIASTLDKLYFPYGRLAQASDGTLYGMDEGPDGNGRIYKLSARDELSTLHAFPLRQAGRGQLLNDIILAADGWLYGLMAYSRGTPGAPGADTAANTPTGILFKLDPARPDTSYTVLREFTLADGEFNTENAAIWQTSNTVDGTSISFLLSDTGMNTLTQGPDGHLYGTSSVSACNIYTTPSRWLFRPALQAYEKVTIRYVTPSLLCGQVQGSASMTTGATPYTTKWEYPADSNRYDVGFNSNGTLFRIGTDGSNFQTLHRFDGINGATPRGPLAFIGNTLYGTTLSGGSLHNFYFGNPYKPIPLGWTRNNLSADKTESDYAFQVSDGVLYALDMDKWRSDPDSAFSVRHEFSERTTGKSPTGVTLGQDGALYGSTRHGGAERWFDRVQGGVMEYDYSNSGTIWRYGADQGATINLAVFPASIKRGETARITWTASGVVPGSCTATSKAHDWDGPQAEDGSVDVTKAASGVYTYSLSCVNSTTGTPIGSNIATLRVDSVASETDGNAIKYTGGGGALPLWPALALLLLAAGRRARKPY